MSTNPKNGKPKSVRFSSDQSSEQPSIRPKKRPRIERPNEDEQDDVDEWVNDEGDQQLPTERELLNVKRNRRLKRQGDDLDEDFMEETNIDNDTSLISDKQSTGIPIEPFNMKAEETDGSGYFVGDMYVFRKRDDEGEPDAWLDSLAENDKKQSETAKPRVDKQSETSENETDELSKEELYARILPLVSDSETIVNALVRYGDLIKRQQKDKVEAVKLSQQALNDLTGAANALLLKGDVDIYQRTRKDIMEMVPDEIPSEPEPRPFVKWEYKGNQDGKIHGPYSTQEMLGWTKAGYFIGAQAVLVRTVTKSDKPKTTADELLSDLMDDDEDARKDEPDERGEWMSSNSVNFNSYS